MDKKSDKSVLMTEVGSYCENNTSLIGSTSDQNKLNKTQQISQEKLFQDIINWCSSNKIKIYENKFPPKYVFSFFQVNMRTSLV